MAALSFHPPHPEKSPNHNAVLWEMSTDIFCIEGTYVLCLLCCLSTQYQLSQSCVCAHTLIHKPVQWHTLHKDRVKQKFSQAGWPQPINYSSSLAQSEAPGLEVQDSWKWERFQPTIMVWPGTLCEGGKLASIQNDWSNFLKKLNSLCRS